MADNWNAHVLPHGPLEAHGGHVWSVAGVLPSGPVPRRMAVWRRDDGGLVVHSAIAMNDEGMAALAALGTPKVMIVPNALHRLDAAVWKARFPELKVYAPAASRAAVEKKVGVDGTVEEAGGAIGAGVVAPAGVKPSEYIYDAHGAWILADVMMNLPPLPGFGGWVFGVIGSTGFFGITGIGRMLLLKDRSAFKAWLASQPAPAAIIPAHGDVIMTGTGAALQAAAGRL